MINNCLFAVFVIHLVSGVACGHDADSVSKTTKTDPTTEGRIPAPRPGYPYGKPPVVALLTGEGTNVRIQNIGTNIPRCPRGRWRSGEHAVVALLSRGFSSIDSVFLRFIVNNLDADRNGTPLKDMLPYLETIYHVSEEKQPTFRTLIGAIQKKRPTLVSLQLDPHTSHWAIVIGYTANERGEIQTWHVVDDGIVGPQVVHHKFAEMWIYENANRKNSCVLLSPKDD